MTDGIELQIELCEPVNKMGFGVFHDGIYIGRITLEHVRDRLRAMETIKERWGGENPYILKRSTRTAEVEP
jgi:hypothetical protein